MHSTICFPSFLPLALMEWGSEQVHRLVKYITILWKMDRIMSICLFGSKWTGPGPLTNAFLNGIPIYQLSVALIENLLLNTQINNPCPNYYPHVCCLRCSATLHTPRAGQLTVFCGLLELRREKVFKNRIHWFALLFSPSRKRMAQQFIRCFSQSTFYYTYPPHPPSYIL